ncbi:hypothetical protein D3C80_1096400 [compost metagenome]
MADGHVAKAVALEILISDNLPVLIIRRIWNSLSLNITLKVKALSILLKLPYL